MSQVTKNRNYHGLRLHYILEINTDLERKRIKRKTLVSFKTKVSVMIFYRFRFEF